jgi:hypothetical protein
VKYACACFRSATAMPRLRHRLRRCVNSAP